MKSHFMSSVFRITSKASLLRVTTFAEMLEAAGTLNAITRAPSGSAISNSFTPN